MKTNLKKFTGNKVTMKVKDSVKNGKNIYKNTKGHENEINTVLVDLPSKKSGLKNLMVTMNTVCSGKVNKESKMTRGHKHDADEVYLFLKGSGKIIIDKKKLTVKKDDLVTVPSNKYHRVINTGRNDLVFLTIFQKHGQSHLKSY
ncbi:MAG: cupin domain-containing protein [Candidatus Aenigmarchaeota archaeon]|nr:cupin domain-containing protein [Candidatus Aenigmarchaeota archaeon]